MGMERENKVMEGIIFIIYYLMIEMIFLFPKKKVENIKAHKPEDSSKAGTKDIPRLFLGYMCGRPK